MKMPVYGPTPNERLFCVGGPLDGRRIVNCGYPIVIAVDSSQVIEGTSDWIYVHSENPQARMDEYAGYCHLYAVDVEDGYLHHQRKVLANA